MRRGLAVATAALVTAVGCGPEERADPVVGGSPPATPYTGPLDVATTTLDTDTPRSLLAESGAAGRALECDGEIYTGGGPDGWSAGDGGDTPEDGLRLFFDMFQPQVPGSGYRVEREADGRVLYSYDVGGRTKVAVVVAQDQKGRPGWGPETNASCDPAELPAAVTDSLGLEIWTDRDGHRVATTTVTSHAGAEHCGWQKAHFLGTGRGEGYRQYVRDPGGVLESGLLTAPYDADVRMPADARGTGYRYGHWRLWLTKDRKTAYVRTPDGVEAWPSAKRAVACK
ncbi:hypothetical protein [Streptomyces sp. DSM 15324]|uniref:hypothetical protein n=1 Tax=Streptomyces sp. DSM 15324 TaxID=1739111 RepID=UPI00074A6BC2|nr:hypothetical protein [Streptomyces sp. DSM 15324]KUO09035.1 hypothetical protein AQJ58_26980 [Streptomyces sp. DSM 15324]